MSSLSTFSWEVASSSFQRLFLLSLCPFVCHLPNPLSPTLQSLFSVTTSHRVSRSLVAMGRLIGSYQYVSLPHRAWPIVGCCWERRIGKKKGREERTWSLPWLMEYVIFCSRERGNLRDSPHNFQCEIVQPVLYVMKEEGKNNESHSRGSGTGAGH